METDKKGCSTCLLGEENYEYFEMNGKEYVQYDFRHINGYLFSCVAKTLEIARDKRNKWIDEK